MRVPQKRQIGCSSTSSAGFSTSSELSARSNSSAESWRMALDVMSFGVTRKTWSGLCLGSSCIFPSYLHAANHCHRCVVISSHGSQEQRELLPVPLFVYYAHAPDRPPGYPTSLRR